MNALAQLKQWCEQQQQLLLGQSAWRTLGPLLPADAIDFSSNDYLGLRSQALPLEQIVESTHQNGIGSGASRVVVQASSQLNQLEKYAAKWLQWPRTLYCQSGFSANVSLFEAAASLPDVACFLDVRAHASLFVGARASRMSLTFFRHHDYAQLEKKLLKCEAEFKLVFVESLHSMDGTYEDAARLTALCRQTGALLIVDEAHSAGIYGEQGRGWVSERPQLKEHVLAVMFGCGKALGVSGGLIAAQEFFIDRIVNTSKAFIYSTAPSPLVAHALHESIATVSGGQGNERRHVLNENIRFACQLQSSMGLQKLVITPHSPILYLQLDNEDKALVAARTLQQQGLFVQAMRPPTVPRGTARLRVVLKATHTQKQIETLFTALAGL